MWIARLKTLLQETTIEPIILLFSLAAFHYPAVQALFYQKVCLTKYSEEICDNLQNGSFPVEEDMVQTETSHWFLYEIICFEIPSIFVATIYGILCDSWSRKVTLVLPLIGQILSTVNTLMIAILKDSPIGFLLFGRIISGFFGGWVTLLMACSSYLSAFTSQKTRTTRIAIMEGLCSVTMAVAGLISGIILDNTSFLFVSIMTLGLYLLTVVYIAIFIKELNEDKTNRREQLNKSEKITWNCTKLFYMIVKTLKTVTK